MKGARIGVGSVRAVGRLLGEQEAGSVSRQRVLYFQGESGVAVLESLSFAFGLAEIQGPSLELSK